MSSPTLKVLVLAALFAAPGLALSATGQKVGVASEADVSNRNVQATGSTTARKLKDRAADVVNVKDYGAVGDGVTDDSAAMQAALSSGARIVDFPDGTYLLTAKLTTSVGQILRGSGRRTARFKKGANGYMLNAAGWVVVQDLGFDGVKATYTGGGIEVTTGDNTATVANQGHQRFERLGFENMDGYAIDYTTANKGWMSSVINCTFTGTNALAAIKWPDEPASGGNRSVVGSYSEGPIVNASGADNGFIRGCTAGGVVASGQGVVFPAGTTNRAKKILVLGNNFGIGGGTMNIRGVSLDFDDNRIAGNVVLESNAATDGFSQSFWGMKNFLTDVSYTLTDSSATTNQVMVTGVQAFTPTWTATGTAPAFGNADVRCEWTRAGAYIRAKYFIIFGTTTTFGTGTWKFSVPVNRFTALSTDFVGAAWLKDRVGGARTLFQPDTNVIQLADGSGNAVTNVSPVAWASGDLLIIEITYRIF